MTPAFSITYRTLLSCAALFLLQVSLLQAQEAATLPDYVIEQFGQPPAIPEGPLSEELESAVRTVFVESFEQGGRNEEQDVA